MQFLLLYYYFPGIDIKAILLHFKWHIFNYYCCFVTSDLWFMDRFIFVRVIVFGIWYIVCVWPRSLDSFSSYAFNAYGIGNISKQTFQIDLCNCYLFQRNFRNRNLLFNDINVKFTMPYGLWQMHNNNNRTLMLRYCSMFYLCLYSLRLTQSVAAVIVYTWDNYSNDFYFSIIILLFGRSFISFRNENVKYTNQLNSSLVSVYWILYIYSYSINWLILNVD